MTWPSEDRLQSHALLVLLGFAAGWSVTVGWFLGLQSSPPPPPPGALHLIGLSFFVLVPAALFAAFQIGRRRIPERSLGAAMAGLLGWRCAEAVIVGAPAATVVLHLAILAGALAIDLFVGWPRFPWRPRRPRG